MPLLERGRRRGWLQAAVDAKGRPQGFALMTELQGNAWLLQLSVRRPVGRRGIGAALLSSICETAGRSGYGAIFLSTARGVPWTEPFYARRGFVPVPLGRYPRWMRHERLTEIQHGHVPYRRVIMQRVLRADAPSAD